MSRDHTTLTILDRSYCACYMKLSHGRDEGDGPQPEAPDFAYRLCAERFQATGAAAVAGRVWRIFARLAVQRILNSCMGAEAEAWCLLIHA
jgi:hypothetical protein